MISTFALFSYAKQSEESYSFLNIEGFENRVSVNETFDDNPFVQPVDDFSINDLILTGVVLGHEKRVALINGAILEEGEKFGNNKIISIEKRRVIIKNQDGIYSLSMKGRRR